MRGRLIFKPLLLIGRGFLFLKLENYEIKIRNIEGFVEETNSGA
jgi:hypothetical protein